MKRFLPARAIIALLLPGFTAGLPTLALDEVTPGQHNRLLDTTVQRHISIPYLLFLPQTYRTNAETRWPLMIFLHGAGERGQDLQLVSVHGPPKIVKTRPDFPFVLVAPQCPAGERWDVEGLEMLLTDLLNRLAVDPKRVYLTGLSMGGYGTWAWAGSHPERFAAIAPICGGGDPIGVWLADGKKREALARLPIWVFHGAKDPVVALAESERMIDAYRRLGNQPKLTVYPEAGHDSWTQSYDNEELYAWLLSQRRP